MKNYRQKRTDLNHEISKNIALNYSLSNKTGKLFPNKNYWNFLKQYLFFICCLCDNLRKLFNILNSSQVRQVNGKLNLLDQMDTVSLPNVTQPKEKKNPELFSYESADEWVNHQRIFRIRTEILPLQDRGERKSQSKGNQKTCS